MVSENHYKITFNGDLVAGAALAEVKANLTRLFKSSDSTIEKLFSGRLMTIKNNISEQQALSYQRAMQKAGAVTQITSIENIDTEQSSAPITSTPMRNDGVNSYSAQPKKNNLVDHKLARPPVIYIKDDEEDDEEDYAPPPPAAITNAAGRLGITPVDQWKMDEVGARISKPKKPTTSPTPNTDYLDLSPPKTEMGQTIRKIETINPDTSYLEVADTGVRLSERSVKEKCEAPDTSYLNVAAVGENMGQAKHVKELKTPDISQLSIDETEGNFKQLKHAKVAVNPDISHLDLE